MKKSSSFLKIILITLIILKSVVQTINAQNPKLDSLFLILKTAKHDSTRCRLFLSIGAQYEKISPDTALLWYNKTYNTATKAKNTHSQDASECGAVFTLYSASALQSLGWVECNYKGNYEKAIEYSNSGFNIFKTIIAKSKSSEIQKKAKNGMSASYNNIGNVHREQGN